VKKKKLKNIILVKESFQRGMEERIKELKQQLDTCMSELETRTVELQTVNSVLADEKRRHDFSEACWKEALNKYENLAAETKKQLLQKTSDMATLEQKYFLAKNEVALHQCGVPMGSFEEGVAYKVIRVQDEVIVEKL
jgi:hypothetical protein